MSETLQFVLDINCNCLPIKLQLHTLTDIFTKRGEQLQRHHTYMFPLFAFTATFTSLLICNNIEFMSRPAETPLPIFMPHQPPILLSWIQIRLNKKYCTVILLLLYSWYTAFAYTLLSCSSNFALHARTTSACITIFFSMFVFFSTQPMNSGATG
jgi:hypothetical protein